MLIDLLINLLTELDFLVLREPMTQITEEVRDQLVEASVVTRKAYNTYRREADPDDHYSSGDGAQSAADKNKDELEMSPVITIMQPILRFLQLLCENHNRDLQVCGTETACMSLLYFWLTSQSFPLAMNIFVVNNMLFL